MEIAVINSNIKCKSSTNFYNKKIEDDYMIKTCKTSILDVKTFEEKAKESFILSILLDNIQFLNYYDECGKKITNCDLTKISNLK